MATAPNSDVDELPDPMRAVLDELHEGDRTRGALSDFTGYSSATIHRYLDLAEAKGYVSNVHEPTALWTLEADPRDPASGGS